MNLEREIDFTVNWLRSYAKEAKARGLLVGVSGGIDSAVVAFLIKRAFPDSSLGVILPCHSSENDLEAAQLVVEAANLPYKKIDLSAMHQELWQSIQEAGKDQNWDQTQERLSDANLRARLRMSTLYALAQQYHYLVVGTDNAAEWHLGYFTKYGDGAVDCQPLKRITKGDVRAWAQYLGVPASIIQRPPSAGLWEGQTDEAELGVSYDVVDAYLKGEEVDEAARERIQSWHRRTQHKRQVPPSPPRFHNRMTR